MCKFFSIVLVLVLSDITFQEQEEQGESKLNWNNLMLHKMNTLETLVKETTLKNEKLEQILEFVSDKVQTLSGVHFESEVNEPCMNFKDRNTICNSANSGKHDCQCKNGHFPIYEGDPCFGCKDPCMNFKDRNTICLPTSSEPECQCKNGYFPIYEGDPCFGCKDPCKGFQANNSNCFPVDFENYKCECKIDYYPIRGDPCVGCIDLCSKCTQPNTVCNVSRNESWCICDKNKYFPIDGNALNGCKECPSSLGFEYFKNYGCLKTHDYEKQQWEQARNTCLAEGGDLFIPSSNWTLLPKQLNLISDWYWIGVRKEGDGNYLRVDSTNFTLTNHSIPWAEEEPDRGIQSCVLYSTGNKLLYDYYCDAVDRFICQIIGI